jgi:hypothetical protein
MQMAVTWTSGYNIGEAYPFVEWRIKGEETSKRTPAGTLTFTQSHLCGTYCRSEFRLLELQLDACHSDSECDKNN